MLTPGRFIPCIIKTTTAASAATASRIATESSQVKRCACLAIMRSNWPSRFSMLSRTCSRTCALAVEFLLTVCIAEPTLDRFSENVFVLLGNVLDPRPHILHGASLLGVVVGQLAQDFTDEILLGGLLFQPGADGFQRFHLQAVGFGNPLDCLRQGGEIFQQFILPPALVVQIVLDGGHQIRQCAESLLEIGNRLIALVQRAHDRTGDSFFARHQIGAGIALFALEPRSDARHHPRRFITHSVLRAGKYSRFDMIRRQIYHPRELRANKGVGEMMQAMMARRKPEIRNQKSEANPKTEIRNRKGSGQPEHCFGFRTFFLPSDFGFRISGFVLLASLAACNQRNARPSRHTARRSHRCPRSFPAATDLIIGMGARDRLVAVSTYDSDNKLPKAGNYETIDWELMRSLHPSVLVTEIAADRQSPGFKSNCADLHIQPVNVTIETLDDIFSALDQLGDALKEPELAKSAHQQMRARLDAVQKQFANDKPVRSLIVVSPGGDGVVGTGTFLDDLLKIAGGVNVVAPQLGHWPQIDREKLLSLKPDVILQLLPDATPQERDQAAVVWKQLPQIPAVAAGRVYPIYDSYALVPGWHVTDLADRFSQCLHPKKD